MTTLFIDRRDALIEAEAGTLTVRGGDGTLWRAPLGPVERVVLRGPARISTGAIAAIAGAGCGLTVLSGRRSEPAGTLLGRPHADAAIRMGQLRLALDPAARGRIAALIVRHKLVAQARLLRRILAGRPDRRPALRRGLAAIGEALARLRGGAEEGRSAAQLHGLEGAAAAAYFEALAAVFPPSLGFAGRNRRPPRDPVNAALSLAYTLAQAEAAREAHLAGLDPAVGFLHALAPGRDSLACDLVEPLRARLDGHVWRLFAEEVLRRAHFTRDGEACLLGKAGRLAFYAAWRRGSCRPGACCGAACGPSCAPPATRRATWAGRGPMLQTLHLDGAEAPVAVLVEGPALRLRRHGIADVFAPLPRLARVLVHGPRVQWRTEALMACLEGGVPVLFLGRRGALAGVLVPAAPPAHRADLAALFDAAAAAPGFRRWLEDVCRAEERAAILALLRREGPVGGSPPDLRPAAVRRSCLARCAAPEAGAALAALMAGLAAALVAEALARRGVGPRFLARRTGGFGLPEALGGALAWPLWPRIWPLAGPAACADGMLTAAARRLAIQAFEAADLAPRRDQLLARLAARLAEEP